MSTAAPSLVEFLTARLDEDDRIAKGLMGATRFMGGEPDFTGQGGPAASAFWQHFASYRMITEVEVKRAIINAWREDEATLDRGYTDLARGAQLASLTAIRLLAAVHSAHPDYRPEWAPASASSR